MRRAVPPPPSRGAPRAPAPAPAQGAAAALVAVLAALPAPAPAGAQQRPCIVPATRPGRPVTLPGGCSAPPPLAAARPRWQGELTTLGVNAAIGGVTGGVRAAARAVQGTGAWRDVPRALGTGLLGGAAIYAGKRVAAARFDGAGLLGRQVAGLGASVVHNAGEGRPALSRVVLPLGLVRVYVGDDADAPPAAVAARPTADSLADTTAVATPAPSRGPALAEPPGTRPAPAVAGRRRAVRLRLDVGTLFGAVQTGRETGARLDPWRSLSAGAPVFLSPFTDATAVAAGSTRRVGYASGGSIWLLRAQPDAYTSPDDAPRAILGHEQVHVVQYDALSTTWAVPAERWLLARVPGGRHVARWADLGLAAGLIGLASGVFPYDDRPWEREAFFLSRTTRTTGPGPR